MQPSTATRLFGGGSGRGMRKLVLALVAACCWPPRRPRSAATKLTITRRRLRPRHRDEPVRHVRLLAAPARATTTSSGHYYTGTALGALDANPEVKVLLQGVQEVDLASPAALNAGDQKLDPAQTYSVRRSAAGLDLRDATGTSVGTVAGPLRVDAPVGQALRLHGTSVPGVRDGLYRGSLLISASGSGLHRRQRARPRGLRARRRQRREPVGVADRGAQGPGRGRAHVRDHDSTPAAPPSTSTPTRARRSTAASRPRRPTPTPPCRPPPARSSPTAASR